MRTAGVDQARPCSFLSHVSTLFGPPACLLRFSTFNLCINQLDTHVLTRQFPALRHIAQGLGKVDQALAAILLRDKHHFQPSFLRAIVTAGIVAAECTRVRGVNPEGGPPLPEVREKLLGYGAVRARDVGFQDTCQMTVGVSQAPGSVGVHVFSRTCPFVNAEPWDSRARAPTCDLRHLIDKLVQIVSFIVEHDRQVLWEFPTLAQLRDVLGD